jgi:CHAT domain-containing protein
VNKGSGKLNVRASFGIVTGQEKYMFGQEAQEVAKLFDSEPFLDATKNMVFQNATKDILHFASHGEFNYTDPLSSGIKLQDSTAQTA